MSMDSSLQAAYVLHTRAYRDTSLIVELLTQQQGRISVIARGVKGKRNSTQGLLQPFVPLLVSYRGKTELKTLSNIESSQAPHSLTGKLLFCGFYINELLMRLLPRSDPYADLFSAYQRTLINLSQNSNVEAALRIFEKQLLSELGYALPLNVDPDRDYHFIPSQGFVPAVVDTHGQQQKTVFSGTHLNAIADNDFTDDHVLKTAKRLMRLALAPLLGPKPLKCRDLFHSKEQLRA